MMLAAATGPAPDLISVWPFAALLLAIAILPLGKTTHHWWENNANKLLVSAILGLVTLGYYYTRPFGVAIHDSHPDPVAASSPSPATIPASSAADEHEA